MKTTLAACKRLFRLLGLFAAQMAVALLVATAPAHALERMEGFDPSEVAQLTTESVPVEVAVASVCHCASHCPGEVFDLASSVAAPEVRVNREVWRRPGGLPPTGSHCSFLERPPRG